MKSKEKITDVGLVICNARKTPEQLNWTVGEPWKNLRSIKYGQIWNVEHYTGNCLSGSNRHIKVRTKWTALCSSHSWLKATNAAIKHFSEHAPHHCGKTASTDMVWRNYVTVLLIKVKEVYLYSAYYELLVWLSSGIACVNNGPHSFTCHPHVYPQVEWTTPAFTPATERRRTLAAANFPSRWE